MSDPVDTSKVGKYAAIQSALGELVSASSSLNMPPDAQECSNCGIAVLAQDGLYLSQTDSNAAHAMEHLHAAFRLMNMAHHDQESLKTQIYRLVVQLQELGVQPNIKTWLDESTEGVDP